jgi:hypothetical protein
VNRIIGTTLVVLSLLISSPTMALGQDRGLVGGQFGATFGTEAAPFFAGEAAGHVSRDIQIYGTFGRMNNVLPSSVQDDLDDVSALLSIITRVPWAFEASAPATFGTAGVRYLIPAASPARPYVQGGLGFANIGLKVEELDLGDVTDDLVADGYLDDDNINKLAIEFGGGLIVPVRSIYIDVGYRFMKLMDADDVNISRAYGGIGVRF